MKKFILIISFIFFSVHGGAQCPQGDFECALAKYFLSVVQLYHDDGDCKEENFIAAINTHANAKYCQVLHDQLSISVWGVKIGNKCFNIYDMSLYDACIKYSGN